MTDDKLCMNCIEDQDEPVCERYLCDTCCTGGCNQEWHDKWTPKSIKRCHCSECEEERRAFLRGNFKGVPFDGSRAPTMNYSWWRAIGFVGRWRWRIKNRSWKPKGMRRGAVMLND